MTILAKYEVEMRHVREEGIEIGVKRVAKNLLQTMNVEEVVRQTGLTLEQVLALEEEENGTVS